MKKLIVLAVVISTSALAIYYSPKSSNKADDENYIARAFRPAVGRPAAAEAVTHPYEAMYDTHIPEIRSYARTAPLPVRPARAAVLPPLERRTVAGAAVREGSLIGYPEQRALFREDFWVRHPSYYPLRPGVDVWRAATWREAANWLADPINEDPYYYDGGYAYPQTEQPSSQTTAKTAEPAPSGSEAQQDPNDQWISLGVFALVTPEKKDAPKPTMYMQLALSKTGAIGGNLYDTTYDKSFPLVGEVDKKSQRAIWKMLHSENSPIIETGLYNLTKDETPVTFRFVDGSTQEFFLVKLHQN